MLRLRWGDLDLERGTISIDAASMKNRRSHVVDMTPTCARFLAALERGAPAAPLFGETPPGSIKKSFRSAERRAGLPHVTFHVLRKTGATLLLDAGASVKAVQQLGGWKRSDVLLKHYAAVTAKARGETVAALDRAIRG